MEEWTEQMDREDQESQRLEALEAEREALTRLLQHPGWKTVQGILGDLREQANLNLVNATSMHEVGIQQGAIGAIIKAFDTLEYKVSGGELEDVRRDIERSRDG